MVYFSQKGRNRKVTIPQTVALQEYFVGSIPQLACILVGLQTANLVAVERNVPVNVQSPVFRIHSHDIRRKLKALVGHIAVIGPHGCVSRAGRYGNVLQQIFCPFVIIVGRKAQAVLQEAEVQTNVVLVRGLPLQVLVQRAFVGLSAKTAVQRPVQRIIGCAQ